MDKTAQTEAGMLVRRSVHRFIRERWIVTGTLILESPAHFGAGDLQAPTDMALLTDETRGTPLLPGTSIAGALRNYLREVEKGFGCPLPRRKVRSGRDPLYESAKARERNLCATLLFGGYRGDDEGCQSPLVVRDAPGIASGYEIRDGVAIDQETGTAADERKYDMQLLSAGSTFDLRFELSAGERPESDAALDVEAKYRERRDALINALATALSGLERGEITLGRRKRRGFGRCRAESWTVRHYDLTGPEGLLAWLASERGEGQDPWVPNVTGIMKPTIIEALSSAANLLHDARRFTHLSATFVLDGSILIRSGFGEADKGPDMVHLHSHRPEAMGRVPVVPGSTWAGVLRYRAMQIASLLAGNSGRAQVFVDSIFGPASIEPSNRKTRASRLMVTETVVSGACAMIQSRVRIDRFTGGTYESSLFDEQPVCGTGNTLLTLNVTLRPPSPIEPINSPPGADEAEAGLLLLLLKDLWTGDLRVGGESGVGRGRLSGLGACLRMEEMGWRIDRDTDGGLLIDGDARRLESFVQKFYERMMGHG